MDRSCYKFFRIPSRIRSCFFAAIRYFGRYPDPGAKETLLAMIADQDPAHWEFAAISALRPGRGILARKLWDLAAACHEQP